MIAWLAKVMGSVLSLKTFLSAVFMVIIGIILYNLMVEVIEEILTFGLAKINGANYGTWTNPSVSGFAGWMMAQLKIPECIGVMATCVALRFVLTKIPFIKW
jgi:hypothetical protein